MRRRTLIALMGGTIGWSLGVRAQQTDPARRIGVLMSLPESDAEGHEWLSIFQQGLRELGWIEDKNLSVQYRWAGGNLDTARAYAAELTALNPDVVLAQSTTALIALKEKMGIIPVVFVNVSDPVGMGFVSSLGRPGGNVTGFSNYEPLIVTKWLEILKEISPELMRLLVVWHPQTTPSKELGRLVESTAKSFAVRVSMGTVRDKQELESIVAAFGREPGGGLLILPGSFTATNRELIAHLAASNRLPAVYPFREWGLASYGSDPRDLFWFCVVRRSHPQWYEAG